MAQRCLERCRSRSGFSWLVARSWVLGILLAIELLNVDRAGAQDVTIDWVCVLDGSQNAEELETYSCQYFKDKEKTCQSCLVSEQSFIERSGLLIQTDDFQCRTTSFTVPKFLDPNNQAGRRLCPGEYFVAGCETNDLDFQFRVNNIRDILLTTTKEPDSCFNIDGVRDDNQEGCQSGFPKFIQLELAARLEAGGPLVSGRNPATYHEDLIIDCPGSTLNSSSCHLKTQPQPGQLKIDTSCPIHEL
mmetsp:Transcript_34981/g.54669  ORF Transcript_34981/g.54669 Transcript_34981/m.54669 type:complete len:246 (+) Transcript_34981:409-1146(+)